MVVTISMFSPSVRRSKSDIEARIVSILAPRGSSGWRREKTSSLCVKHGAAPGRIEGVGRPAMQPRLAFLGMALQHLKIAEHGGQQIVEVVRDAAGELADRFELLRLPQLRLGPLALRHGLAALAVCRHQRFVGIEMADQEPKHEAHRQGEKHRAGGNEKPCLTPVGKDVILKSRDVHDQRKFIDADRRDDALRPIDRR